MEPPFTIRPATPEDARRLADQRVALFAEVNRAGDTEFGPRSEAAFLETLRLGTCHAWLAESLDGEAVGGVAMLIYPRLPSPNSAARAEGYLLNVYTAPAWRRRGIALALIHTALDSARALGLERLRLHTTAAGLAVYTAAGFHLVDNAMEIALPSTR